MQTLKKRKKRKKNSTYLNVEISLRSDQLVGWQNSQWEEYLVGVQTQGFVSNIEAVTPIKQISVLPPLSLQIASLFPSVSSSLSRSVSPLSVHVFHIPSRVCSLYNFTKDIPFFSFLHILQCYLEWIKVEIKGFMYIVDHKYQNSFSGQVLFCTTCHYLAFL